MRGLEEGGRRPVWVKAVLVNDDGVERIVPINDEGEELWHWAILEGDVEFVPRFGRDSDDTSAIPPDRVAHTSHSLFPHYEK